MDSDISLLVQRANNSEHIDLYVDNIININVEPIEQIQLHVVIRPRPNTLVGT